MVATECRHLCDPNYLHRKEAITVQCNFFRIKICMKKGHKDHSDTDM